MNSVEPDMKTLLQFDELRSQNLVGWATAGSFDVENPIDAAHLPVMLKIGDEVIAAWQRCRMRPDADAHVGNGNIPKGFSMPFLAAVVYTGLSNGGRLDELSVAFNGEAWTADTIAPKLRDIGAFRSLRLHENATLRISDLWFPTTNQLRLRIYVDDEEHIDAYNHATIKLYQFDEIQGRSAKLIGRRPLERSGITFISVELPNPYLPVLMTLSDSDNNIRLIDVLPFPSLCRGGSHYAELRALAWTGRYLEDLRIVSDSLVREYFGWDGAPERRSISRIAVNIQSATGAEAIYSAFPLSWMARVFGLAISVDRPPDIETREKCLELPLTHLRASNGNALTAPSPAEGLCLHIPADALPTISSVTARRLKLPAGLSEASGPFVAADVSDYTPRWFVSMPPMPAWLDRLQPRSSVRFYPILSESQAFAEDVDILPAESHLPLAVRFIPTAERDEASLVFPTARDAGDRVLCVAKHSRSVSNTASVSVIISVRDGVADFSNLLNSLTTQSMAQDLEIVVVCNRSSPFARQAIERMLDDMFPGRFKIAEYDHPFNHSAQANLGADHASGDFLVIANSDVVLMDNRTIEVLAIMADNRKIASASCALVFEKGQEAKLRLRSAGVFPVELSYFGRPHLSFGEIDCGSVLSNATYPVVANSFALATVRKDVWEDMEGLNGTEFPTDYNDVDYGLRALDKGLIHLCTTAIAAYHSGRASRGPSSDIHSVRYLRHLQIDRMMNLCTVIRKLE